MSTMVLERQQHFDHHIFGDEGDRHLADARCSDRVDAHGRLTLDDLITGVWEGLAVRDTVRCPACGGKMSASQSSREADIREASCQDCGANLS